MGHAGFRSSAVSFGVCFNILKPKEHEEMSVVSLASLETRQSYFSENLPDKALKPKA